MIEDGDIKWDEDKVEWITQHTPKTNKETRDSNHSQRLHKVLFSCLVRQEVGYE